MKKIVLVAAVMVSCFSTPVAAQDAEPSLCEAISGLAKSTMELRQHGHEAADLIKRVEDHEEPRRGLMRKMIFEAYEQPLLESKEAKESAASEFSNRWFLLCEQAG